MLEDSGIYIGRNTSAEVLKQFDELQQKLVPMWETIGTSHPGGEIKDENTVVVIPSLTLDIDFPSTALQGYEERLLFLLLLLRQPNIRLVYVTSMTIQPDVIDYYLNLVPGVVPSNARKRLFLVSPLDGASDPLTKKILKRPRLIAEIRSLIPDFDRAHMVPFLTTDLERELAVKLGIPMYAADPRFFAFGTKSGCRQIFAEQSVPHPLGHEDLFSVEAVIDAIVNMRAERPTVQRVITKLNEGVSGLGNAVVDLSNLPTPGSATERSEIGVRVRNMMLEGEGADYDSYIAELEQNGAIVEEYISGTDYRSPSAQLRVTPLGEVEMLSTHDQLLGGPSGQSYLGARFPADAAYSGKIMREAVKVGERFAKEGIVGRFALDFVTVRNDDGEWEVYAIEVNLRKGGTTAPFLVLQYLTDGAFDADQGVFTTPNGVPKYYVASDHVESDAYRVFKPDHLFDIVSRHRLHYSHSSKKGIVLHMLTGVGELGRVGVIAIGNAPAEANALYEQFVSVLDQEARLALLES